MLKSSHLPQNDPQAHRPLYTATTTLAAPPVSTALHTQESTVLLAPEQIIAENTAKIPKNEQNDAIRLAASIKKYGVLEPLCVKLSTTESGYPTYVLVDGARRLRAATAAGLSRVPCVILQANDIKCLQLEEISAIKRQNLHFFALAERLLYLMQTLKMTQEELARRLGLSQSAIANKLRLLQFSAEERRFLEASALGERHARALLRIRHPQKRLEVMHAAATQHFNVAQTEAMIAELLGESPNPPNQSKPPENRPFLSQSKHKTADFEKKAAYIQQIDAPVVSPLDAACARDTASFPHSLPEKLPLHAQDSHCKQAPTPSQITRAAVCPSGTEEHTQEQQGITPRKFALRDLTPLYNSIERTLGIFKKTGVAAEYQKEEDDYAARITIYIPKRG